MIPVKAHLRNNRVIPNHDRENPVKKINRDDLLAREMKINRFESFLHRTKGVPGEMVKSIVEQLDKLKAEQAKNVERYLFQEL